MAGLCTKPAAARSFHDQYIACCYFELSDSAKLYLRTISSDDPIRTQRTRLAASHSIGRMRSTSLREQRKRKRAEKLQPSHDSISAAVSATPARPSANRKLKYPHRRSPVEDFRVRESRIGHVNLHGACARRVGSCPAAAAYGFVISKRLVAKHNVVHRSLACRRDAQCAQQHVHNPLRSLHVATRDRWCSLRRITGLGV